MTTSEPILPSTEIIVSSGHWIKSKFIFSGSIVVVDVVVRRCRCRRCRSSSSSSSSSSLKFPISLSHPFFFCTKTGCALLDVDACDDRGTFIIFLLTKFSFAFILVRRLRSGHELRTAKTTPRPTMIYAIMLYWLVFIDFFFLFYFWIEHRRRCCWINYGQCR